MASFVSYARQFGRPLNQVAEDINVVPFGAAGAKCVFEILGEKPELTDAPGALQRKRIDGGVTFEDVCFGYEPGAPVLKHVTMRSHPGEMITLAGPTGVGKTTIIYLLTSFCDVDTGAIRINGVNIRDVKMDDVAAGWAWCCRTTSSLPTP
jgi:ATP-binding cassette subfamily B protein